MTDLRKKEFVSRLADRENALALHDPMNDVRWTLWQALAWFTYRDADRVRDCSESLRELGLNSNPEIWRGLGWDYVISRASVELLRALEAGTLLATGIDTANGNRRELRPLEWCDLQFVEIDPPTKDGPQLYRKGLSTDDFAAGRIEPVFREVRVSVADVLRIFPANARRDWSAPSLEAVLRHLLSENPKLTQIEIVKIARERGATEPRKKIRAMWKTLGGSSKPGPRGPRKNHAAPSA